MFGLGLPELGIVAIVAIMIFGPKKIPEIGSALGKTLRGFKDEITNAEKEENSAKEETPTSSESEKSKVKDEV